MDAAEVWGQLASLYKHPILWNKIKGLRASVIHDALGDLIEADETRPLVFLPTPKELYSYPKALGDELVLKHNNPADGFLTTCIRPASIFGKNDGSAKSFVDRAAAGKLKDQIGNGKNLFDWTYVWNVIDAHILAAHKLLHRHKTPSLIQDETLRVDGQGFLITNDEHIAFWEFARAIGDAAGYPTRKEDVKSIPRFVEMGMAILAE